MDDRVDEPLRLRVLLDHAGRRLGLGASAEVARLWAGWAEIVGPAMANHAEPSSFRDGVLKVRTDSPTWATEVAYLSGSIREAANRWVGREVVREVRVWTSPTKVRARRARGPTQNDEMAAPRTRDREPESDPRRAFEKARKAWAARRAQRRGESRPEPGQSGKTSW
jgi:predicted nucleic acid-binding Zn ribbon protein